MYAILSLCNSMLKINFGVNGGDRTHDHQSHNLVLYQLSYIHHADSLSIAVFIGKIKDAFLMTFQPFKILFFGIICYTGLLISLQMGIAIFSIYKIIL